MSKKDLETYCPSSRADWRKWLAENHQSKSSVWLMYYKAATNIPSLSWSEAVDEALCFGWIDSTKKSIDSKRYKQYFTRRKPNSNWSKVNKEKVARLIQSGQMTPAGLASIETAKQNGSWTLLDEVEALVIPADLEEALIRHQGSKVYFDSLSKSARKILLYWVVSAKRAETRKKRILEIAANASKGLKPEQFR